MKHILIFMYKILLSLLLPFFFKCFTIFDAYNVGEDINCFIRGEEVEVQSSWERLMDAIERGM